MFGKKSEDNVYVPPTPVPAPVVAPKVIKQPDGFIGAHITIKGDVHFEGELNVQGRITGNVLAVGEGQSILHVENGAEINGNIKVPTVKIDGFVAGSIDSSELVEISSTGEVSGPVKYSRLAIESGAIIDGQLTPVDADEPASSVGQVHAEVSSYDINQ